MPLWLRGLLVREALLVVALALTVLTALGLGWSINHNARQTAVARVDGVTSLLLTKLETEGIGTTANFAADLIEIAPGGPADLNIGLWRMIGESRQWIVHPGTLAEAMVETEAGTRMRPVTAGETDVYLSIPDVPDLSKDWATPLSGVGLAVALIRPTAEERVAGSMTLWLLGGLGTATLLIILAAIGRRRRYRRALQGINRELEQFSEGATDTRVTTSAPLPELRELAQQLNDVLNRLEELISGLRLVSGYVAHELKTPLQLIRGEVGRFERAVEAPERERIAHEINRAIDGADGRLASMTELSRLEADTHLKLTPGLDLSALVEDAVDEMIGPLEDRGLTVDDQLTGGIAVAGHERLLKLLLENLLRNCLKYAPNGATVRVSLAEGAAPGRFTLSVGNDGAGFPPDIRATAFQSFVRSRQNSDKPGTGLGLSLVHAIARRHGFRAEIGPAEDEAMVEITGPMAESGAWKAAAE